MLLGSPPDMVHGVPSHRTHPPVCPKARGVRLISILYLSGFCKRKIKKVEVDVFHIFYFFVKNTGKHRGNLLYYK